MRHWVCVAGIVGTKTLSGRLVVYATAGLSSLMREGLEFVFVPPRFDAPRKGTIQSFEAINEKSFLVQFDTISDIDTAEKLLGCSCLVAKSNLPKDYLLEKADIYQGFEVSDSQHGQLGKVIDFIEHPLQSRLVVKGNYGEISIPFVEDYCEKIDKDKQLIYVKLPKGYLEAVSQGL